MNRYYHMRMVMTALLSGAAVQLTQAATVNTWRGDAVNADWNESYKWNLKHAPTEGEAVHFRQDNSVISVNSTIQLDNGMHLYGQELLLKGNGNINLWSIVPHERSVNIPASADGYANLTLCDNLSLNGRVSLSAKGFGTSASKGTLTLADRSTVTGGLVIGNEGVGSGQVFVKDNATFRITNLEINTRADQGGMAEIHILGGTVRIETDANLYEVLMADPSRKIILGDTGTLRIESALTIAEKKEMIKELIASNRLVAAPGCRLTPPILQDEMLIARAEDNRFQAAEKSRDELLIQIDSISEEAPAAGSTASDLGALVNSLNTEEKESLLSNGENAVDADAESGPSKVHMAGYVVIFGSMLLALRRTA